MYLIYLNKITLILINNTILNPPDIFAFFAILIIRGVTAHLDEST